MPKSNLGPRFPLGEVNPSLTMDDISISYYPVIPSTSVVDVTLGCVCHTFQLLSLERGDLLILLLCLLLG
jgi:hypothetical protein